MEISDRYFVLEQIPSHMMITDFRNHEYHDLKSLKPGEITGTGTVNANLFLRGLADTDPEILRCQSRKQLYTRLEKLASAADTSADAGALDKSEMSLCCAIRDNTYQIMELLK
jgi:hypothetical protein